MSNVFSFTGTIGRDAEVRYTPSGIAILNVTVTNNIGFGDKQKTLWVRVTLFGKRAEGTLKDYLKKGQQVFVSGELTTNEYQANDGTTKFSLDVNANIIDLVGSKRESSAGSPANNSAPKPNPISSSNNNVPYDDFDDDIPF